MEKIFNINSHVKVKLTAEGVKILKAQYNDLLTRMTPQARQSMGPFKEPKVDNEGYSEFQLWVLMKHFGNYMYNGNMNWPFHMDIKISEDSLFDEQTKIGDTPNLVNFKIKSINTDGMELITNKKEIVQICTYLDGCAGVITPKGIHIYRMAEIIYSLFLQSSMFHELKTIAFEFNGTHIEVQKKNSSIEEIVKQYYSIHGAS